jgi:S-adenosylmethionine:tRNA ribosyltransferase-isomerase
MNPPESMGYASNSDISQINLSDFDYTLPDENIAQHPLEERDKARMLVYRQGEIQHKQFTNLPEELPANSLLFFNDTQVFHARLLFEKETGAQLEVFCLEPVEKHREINLIMWDREEVEWYCMVRNIKKWPEGEPLIRKTKIAGKTIKLMAYLEEKNGHQNRIRFKWRPQHLSFNRILEIFGEVPLPPYIEREPEEKDAEAYQTVFANRVGAVAAPTAGLHFTQELLDALADQGIHQDYLTLHAGAGTFQPIQTETVAKHPMHEEQLLIRWENIQHLKNHEGPVIAVGTTALRTLESLYWYGVKLSMPEGGREFFIPKLLPYQLESNQLPSIGESLRAVENEMRLRGTGQIAGFTELFIMPGYDFKMADGLITNFHMPKSSLLMLVAAFTKGDWWRIYQEALDMDYRFLSYGDGSLLLP